MASFWQSENWGSLAQEKRVELKDKLGLSGCEVSVNTLDAGQAVPFVHKHKQNEELYLVIAGSGSFWVDGEVIPLKEGSCVKVLPEEGRCLRAGAASPMTYICIQTTQGSLTQYTRTDGVILDIQPTW